MPECADIELLLSAGADGELGSEERDRLASHVASCPRCAGWRQDMAGIRKALRSLPEEDPPPILRQRLRAQVQPPRPARPRPGRLFLAAAAVMLAFLGLLAWLGATAPEAGGERVPPLALSRGYLEWQSASPLGDPALQQSLLQEHTQVASR